MTATAIHQSCLTLCLASLPSLNGQTFYKSSTALRSHITHNPDHKSSLILIMLYICFNQYTAVIFVETKEVSSNRTDESIQIFGLVLPFIKRLAFLGRNVAKGNVNNFVLLLKIGISFLLCYVCMILLNKSSIVVDVRLSKLPRKLCPTMPIAQMAFLAAAKEKHQTIFFTQKY